MISKIPSSVPTTSSLLRSFAQVPLQSIEPAFSTQSKSAFFSRFWTLILLKNFYPSLTPIHGLPLDISYQVLQKYYVTKSLKVIDLK